MHHFTIALSTADVSPVTAPILLNGRIEDNLKKAAEMGFDGIEVHMREDHDLDIGSVREAMDRTGTKIAMVVTGRLNTEGGCSLIDDRPYVAAAAMAGMRRYVDIARALDAGLVIGWVKGTIPPGRARGPYMKRLGKALCELSGYAGSVPLNIEAINRYETNIFNTAEETRSFIEEYGLDNCFVHLDTFHMNIEEVDMAGAIRATGKMLGYFHVADNNRRAVGEGSLNFGPILSALRDVGYKGYVSVECLPLPTGEAAAKASLARLRELMSGT